MTIPNIMMWAKKKGIGLIATGDWTHPLWFKDIVTNLEEVGNGFLKLRQNAEVAGDGPGASLGVSFAAHPSNLSSSSLKGNTQSGDVTVLEKTHLAAPGDPLFLLATEVSSIFTQNGKGRRIHTLIWVPSIASAEKINKEMTRQGCNLMSDGRPIIGLSCIQIAELVFSIEPKALVIPAHAWTPWFGVYGAMSGFNSLEEAFGPYAKQIYAVETGLSSNPSMNWQIKELDNRAIVSFSDAHSGPKLGREATVFEIEETKDIRHQTSDKKLTIEDFSYDLLYQAITAPAKAAEVGMHSSAHPSNLAQSSVKKSKQSDDVTVLENAHLPAASASKSRIAYTIEFYPEEGKYHYTGHKDCNIRWGPQESRKKGTSCPVCGKPLTQGVVQRVEELAGRTEESLQLTADSYQLTAAKTIRQKDDKTIREADKGAKLKMIGSKKFPNRPPFVMLVPLQEIIAECIGSPVASKKTQAIYEKLTEAYGGEFPVLLSATHEQIEKVAGERIAVGIEKVRSGDIVIDPGYDGVFGVVKLWKEGEEKPLVDASKEQMTIF